MELRRRRAVILATLPASLTACFVAVTTRVTNHHVFQLVLGVWLVFVICCFAFAVRELRALKNEGECAR